MSEFYGADPAAQEAAYRAAARGGRGAALAARMERQRQATGYTVTVTGEDGTDMAIAAGLPDLDTAAGFARNVSAQRNWSTAQVRDANGAFVATYTSGKSDE